MHFDRAVREIHSHEETTRVELRRIDRLPPYVFSIVNDMKAEARRRGEDIIDLGMGNPDLPTPQPIVDKLTQAAQNSRNHRYSASRGIAKLRDAPRCRIAVVAAVLGRLRELVHDGLRGGQIGVAHAEVDDVLAPATRLGLHVVHDAEDVGRQAVYAAEFHACRLLVSVDLADCVIEVHQYASTRTATKARGRRGLAGPPAPRTSSRGSPGRATPARSLESARPPPTGDAVRHLDRDLRLSTLAVLLYALGVGLFLQLLWLRAAGERPHTRGRGSRGRWT